MSAKKLSRANVWWEARVFALSLLSTFFGTSFFTELAIFECLRLTIITVFSPVSLPGANRQLVYQPYVEKAFCGLQNH
jgi:hypothetical protein